MLQMGNKGAFIRFEAPDMKPNIVTFSAVVSGFYLEMSFLFLYINTFTMRRNSSCLLSPFMGCFMSCFYHVIIITLRPD